MRFESAFLASWPRTTNLVLPPRQGQLPLPHPPTPPEQLSSDWFQTDIGVVMLYFDPLRQVALWGPSAAMFEPPYKPEAKSHMVPLHASSHLFSTVSSRMVDKRCSASVGHLREDRG